MIRYAHWKGELGEYVCGVILKMFLTSILIIIFFDFLKKHEYFEPNNFLIQI